MYTRKQGCFMHEKILAENNHRKINFTIEMQ